MKKKVQIITIHSIHNFGSVLQAYALNEFLSNIGYDTQIIDYRPNYLSMGRNSFKTMVGRLINFNAYRIRDIKFNQFIDEKMKLTKSRYTDLIGLHDLDDPNAIFVSGGDQLWNDYHPCGHDSAFKLSFVKQGKKIALGTSMGRSNQTEEELKALLRITSSYLFIGLREKSTVDLLNSYKAEVANHLCDPALLIDKQIYKNLLIKPKIKDKYVVVYLVSKSVQLNKVVRYIKEKLNLKVVHICGFQKKCDNDFFLKDVGPREILGYIQNAEFVISGSFHATLFSTLFNKQFITLLPNKNTNERILDFLEYIGLSDRIYDENVDIEKYVASINYTKANAELDKFVSRSKKVIMHVMGEINEE